MEGGVGVLLAQGRLTTEAPEIFCYSISKPGLMAAPKWAEWLGLVTCYGAGRDLLF